MTSIRDLPDVPDVRDPSPDTEAIFATLDAACAKGQQALATVGGNVLIHVQGVGNWTLVTSGPRMGMYAEATPDTVDFMLACEEWVLHELFDEECDPDIAEYIEEGVLYLEGDIEVFRRLLRIAQGGGNVVSLRLD